MLQTINIMEEVIEKLNKIESQIALLVDAKKLDKLSRAEVCERYGISNGTLHNLMRRGKLKYQKIGRRTLFDAQHLEEVLG